MQHLSNCCKCFIIFLTTVCYIPVKYKIWCNTFYMFAVFLTRFCATFINLFSRECWWSIYTFWKEIKKINTPANENLSIKTEKSLQMSVPHLSLRHQERRLFALRKFMKLKFLYLLKLMKEASFCLGLWRKETLLSRFLSNIQLFQSKWWWSKGHCIWFLYYKSTYCRVIPRGKFFGSDLYLLLNSRLCLVLFVLIIGKKSFVIKEKWDYWQVILRFFQLFMQL